MPSNCIHSHSHTTYTHPACTINIIPCTNTHIHTIYRAATYIYIVSCMQNGAKPLQAVKTTVPNLFRSCTLPNIHNTIVFSSTNFTIRSRSSSSSRSCYGRRTTKKKTRNSSLQNTYILGVLIAIYVVHTGGERGKRGRCVRFALFSQLYLCHMDYSAKYFGGTGLNWKQKHYNRCALPMHTIACLCECVCVWLWEKEIEMSILTAPVQRCVCVCA